MSQFYEADWDLLQNLYHEPLNFTDECGFDATKDNAEENVGLVPCKSVCITMHEQSQIGGLDVNGFIRGCYDHILHRGFNETITRRYHWRQRDSCHWYNRKDVLQLGQNAPDGFVSICTCHGDGCNGDYTEERSLKSTEEYDNTTITENEPELGTLWINRTEDARRLDMNTTTMDDCEIWREYWDNKKGASRLISGAVNGTAEDSPDSWRIITTPDQAEEVGLNPALLLSYSKIKVYVEEVCAEHNNTYLVNDIYTYKNKTKIDKFNCYSCMSQFYEADWDRLQNLYHEPLNFTDECSFDATKDNAEENVGLVPCKSVCITMHEQSQIGGLDVNGFTRGCYDHILHRGFNETITRWYRWLQRDSCHEYSRKDVLQLGQNAPDGVVSICTCYGDVCNGSS